MDSVWDAMRGSRMGSASPWLLAGTVHTVQQDLGQWRSGLIIVTQFSQIAVETALSSFHKNIKYFDNLCNNLAYCLSANSRKLHMASPHSARPRQGYPESQPAKPSKPLEYIEQNRPMVDISSASSSGTRRAHGPSPKTDTSGWYSTPAHSPPNQLPPSIPPKVSGSTRSSDSSIAGVQKPYAQKVKGESGLEGNEFIAELEGGMVGLGLSNVDAEDSKKARDTLKKGKRSHDTGAIAQAIVNQSRAPPRKRKIRVLSLGRYFLQFPKSDTDPPRWGRHSWLFDPGYPLGHYASSTCSHKQACSCGPTPASPPVRLL